MKYFGLFLFWTAASVFAQSDTTAVPMEEVIVTGQFSPRSIRKSVFNVKTISREQIDALAAVTLADVLNQYLNITVTPSNTSGRSTVSLFGLDGQYFKILVDNVPLVSENGLGNNIDLTQINLDLIERIEIVEGSMGVTHGANAVSGILNLITKKSTKSGTTAELSLQEETVGKEYAWMHRGRHVQRFALNHTFSNRWSAAAVLNRNIFTGFLNRFQGKNYTTNDGLRGYEWLPKAQYNASSFLNYSVNQFKVTYKLDYLWESLEVYNRVVFAVNNPPFEPTLFSADSRYKTQRQSHVIQIDSKLSQTYPLAVSFSYQNQRRDRTNFQYNHNTDTEQSLQKRKDQGSDLWYSTGTLSKIRTGKRIEHQFGYEAVRNLGFSLVSAENNLEQVVEKSISNADLFWSAESDLTPKFQIRTGLRYSFQDRFDNQIATSAQFKVRLHDRSELRFGYGRSYRTPNFEELYSQIIFSGHYFVGNQNLLPETSHAADLGYQTRYKLGNVSIQSGIQTQFLFVNNRISMALVETVPMVKSQYINISKYQMQNFSITNSIQWQEIQMQAGLSLIGISQELQNGEAISSDKFLYSVLTNFSATYQFKKINSTFAIFYKYTGRQQQFQATTNDAGEATYDLATLSDFGWLDATFTKNFKSGLSLGFGARNVLDVGSINQSNPNAGGVHSSGNGVLLGYGRSYFLKLSYLFNI
ncbi:TonB-dependent receptor plug domain-containing protein [Flavobacterium aurantiibacter]|uniref:TonB-dependent receptor plug domain-containing protein n=1 Tax=Flavobacterium aurantiibacter TaxID=2023067 RepID=A0A255ZQQ9_9FLAO|nr:TonB-dependent receptor plug domain-containing protein [Flavobacterium aurantiibacter]OYQ43244.1 hypothetical protein CHX27_10945 [Flavobacterium aurantiibacter]